MDSKSAKYRVSVAQSFSWFPGHKIVVFEFITSKTQELNLAFLNKKKEEAGIKGVVIGTVLVEKGKPVKKTPAKTVKVADK